MVPDFQHNNFIYFAVLIEFKTDIFIKFPPIMRLDFEVKVRDETKLLDLEVDEV